ncbi:MAG: hypothetical protein ACTSR3_03620 [Candidatus Helarchaeota archaeon]
MISINNVKRKVHINNINEDFVERIWFEWDKNKVIIRKKKAKVHGMLEKYIKSEFIVNIARIIPHRIKIAKNI